MSIAMSISYVSLDIKNAQEWNKFVAKQTPVIFTLEEFHDIGTYDDLSMIELVDGKCWKQTCNFPNDPTFTRCLICRWVQITSDTFGIAWYRPVIRVKAKSFRTTMNDHYSAMLNYCYYISGCDWLDSTGEAKHRAKQRGWDFDAADLQKLIMELVFGERFFK